MQSPLFGPPPTLTGRNSQSNSREIQLRLTHKQASAWRRSGAAGNSRQTGVSVSFKTSFARLALLTVMKIEFIASVAVITADPSTSRRLYVDAIGLPLEGQADYIHSENIGGCKSFGVWPLAQAAQACFGTSEWPADRAVPQASIEFEVPDADAVAAAGEELRAAGYELLHPAREEPWGQTVARMLSSEGLIVGISYTPALRD
jgi:catechol 2,3-dioxygenase-like lactoylglutathione lyase family enzyme